MELKYDIKFEITDEEKAGIMLRGMHHTMLSVLVLMIVAGIVGVTVAVFHGWYLGMGAFMFIAAVVLMLRGWLLSRFLYAGIDELMKQKLARL